MKRIIAILAGIFCIVASAVMAVNTARITALEHIEEKTSDRWRGSDQKEWAEELQRLNPDLKLPQR